jgi:hypothetical protein
VLLSKDYEENRSKILRAFRANDGNQAQLYGKSNTK